MIDHRASPGCAGHQPTQEEFFDGLRGAPLIDDTRGTTTRSKGSRKSRETDKEGWTAFDLKIARDRGLTVADLNAARLASRSWLDAFKARVEADLVARGIDLNAPIPGCVSRSKTPF